MSRLHVWVLISAVLIFGAGGAIGWLVASRKEAETALVTSTTGDFWNDWVVTGEDFWEQLKVEESTRRELRRQIAGRLEQAAALRAEIESLARETKLEVLAMLSPGERSHAGELLEPYEDQGFVGPALRELVALRSRLDLTLDQEASVYRIVYDVARQRAEAYEDICAKRERNGPDCRNWKAESRERMKMIYALRDDRLQHVLSEEQFARHQEWVAGCRKEWNSRRERKRPEDDDSAGEDKNNASEVP